MREFLARHRAAIAAFFALTLPLFLLYVHGRHPRKTTIIEVVLMEVTGPVQGAASTVFGGLGDLWTGYIALVDVRDDNEALEREVAELTVVAEEVEHLKLENARLREMMDFKKVRRDLVLVGAHVIGRSVSPYSRVMRVTVDVGADHQITEDMPVINHAGLVGRVVTVSPSYAEILLTNDARSTVDVKVRGKGVTGTVTGTTAPASYTARMAYLHKAEPLAVGDVLETSGHDKVFPPDLKVGYIRSLEERQRGVEYLLDVIPAVNFSDVDLVYVVVDVVQADAAAAPDDDKRAP